MFHKKRIVTGCVIAACVAGLAIGAGDDKRGKKKMEGWIQRIKSPNEKSRIEAGEVILKERRIMVTSLLNILKHSKKDFGWLNSNTTYNICIRILGEMRAPEAVSELMKWIFPQKGPYVSFEELLFSPAGRALVKIGKPSVPHLLKALKTETNKEHRHICLRILEKIEGKEISVIILKQAVKQEKDPKSKKNLLDALKLFQKSSGTKAK